MMHAIETVRSIATPLAAITALGILPIVSIMAIFIKDASIEPLTTVSEPWTLVTASFVEKNVLVMILHAALGIVFTSAVERRIGTPETVKLMMTTVITANACTFMTLFAMYFFTRNVSFITSKVYGFSAPLLSVLVAAKALRATPIASVPTMPPIFVLASEYGAAAYSLAWTLLLTIGGANAGNVISILMSFICAWVYVRRGAADMSDEERDAVRIEQFVPEACGPAVRNIVRALMAPIDAIVVRRVGGDARRQDTTTRRFAGSGGRPLPGSTDEEARRRRQRGAKALQERLEREDMGGSSSLASGDASNAKVTAAKDNGAAAPADVAAGVDVEIGAAVPSDTVAEENTAPPTNG